MKGIGPATVRGEALIAELVFGEKPSWKDPVKYSFAYGGKDGVPYPVNRQAMDESIQILRDTVQALMIEKKTKLPHCRICDGLFLLTQKPHKCSSTKNL